jgi:hypothetical protein
MVTSRFEPRADDKQFAIMIAHFDGDESDSLGAALQQAVRSETGLTVLRTCHHFSPGLQGTYWDGIEAAGKITADVLEYRNAEAMVWGARQGSDITAWVSLRTKGVSSQEKFNLGAIHDYVRQRMPSYLGDLISSFDIDETLDQKLGHDRALKKLEALAYNPQVGWASLRSLALFEVARIKISIAEEKSNLTMLLDGIETMEWGFKSVDITPDSISPREADLSWVKWRKILAEALSRAALPNADREKSERAITIMEVAVKLEGPLVGMGPYSLARREERQTAVYFRHAQVTGDQQSYMKANNLAKDALSHHREAREEEKKRPNGFNFGPVESTEASKILEQLRRTQDTQRKE